MHDVLGVDMTRNGAFFCAVLFLIELVTVPVCGLFVDIIRSTEKLSTTVLLLERCSVLPDLF